jgi:serine/threonine-protein kinase
MRPSTLTLLATLLFASTLAPRSARADAKSDALQELKRGYALKQAGDCRGAMPHFVASQSLLPSAKALLNLADCEQRLGDMAAARAHAQEGRALAREQNDSELVALADEQILAIDEKLPRAPSAPAPEPAPASIARSEPAAASSGASPNESSQPSPTGSDVSDGSTRRAIAYALGGIGVVGIGIGSAFGLVAISKNGNSNADGHCDTTGCDPTGKQLREDALGAATVSTVAFATGLAALAAGVVVYVTAPKGVRVGPALGASFEGITVQGRW